MTKTIDPRNARSQRTRDALLAATRAILEEDGFEALTMAGVAGRAKVTRRAVYLHFSSRTELVVALFDYIAAQEGLADSVEPVRTAPDGVATLRAWVHHLVDYHPRLMAVDRAIERVRQVDADAARHREIVTAAQLETCRMVAGRLAADGRLAPHWTVDTAATMLWGLISTDLFERLLSGWSPAELEDHLQALYHATFVRGA